MPPTTKAPDWIEPINASLQTHVSELYFSEHFVLKRKKALQLAFLDHRSAAQRWQSIADELRLNRRLATGMYLGIVADSQGASESAACCFCDSPLASEYPQAEPYLVMRRLPEQGFMDQRLQQGAVSDQQLDLLSRKIREFHQRYVLAPDTYSIDQLIANPLRENYAPIRESSLFSSLPPELQYGLGLCEAWSSAQLAKRSGALEQRLRAGCFVDGHGDLRCEHIWYPEPAPLTPEQINIFDCLEFSAQLRATDRLCDLSFLLAELHLLGHSLAAHRVLEAYCEAGTTLSGSKSSNPCLDLPDSPKSPLLPLYILYRALVRAKVHCLWAQQDAALRSAQLALARSHASLALRCACGVLQPQVLIVCGMMASGKSTIAAGLARALGITQLNSDRIRKEIFEHPARAYEPFGQGLFSEQANQHTYATLFSRAQQSLEAGQCVILDATFPSSSLRAEALALAQRMQVPITVLYCEASETLVRARLARREAEGSSVSDGRLEIYDQHRRAYQVPSESEPLTVLKLDSSGSPEESIQVALRLLTQR